MISAGYDSLHHFGPIQTVRRLVSELFSLETA